MRNRVKKCGNSLAVRIPSALAAEAGLKADAPVEVKLVEGSLVIEPVARHAVRLADMLAKVTVDNIRDEVDLGPAVGDEAW